MLGFSLLTFLNGVGYPAVLKPLRSIELFAVVTVYRHPSIDVSADIVCSGAVGELRRILILTSEYRLCYGYHGNPSDGHC
jgi:hypothetical protein